MNKNLTCLSFIFLLQFLATSCDFCGCGPIRTYKKTYNELSLNSYDTSGFRNEEVVEFVPKNSFGISIFVESELQQISSLKKHNLKNFSSLGFSAAYACSCAPDKYTSSNNIASIKILVTNTENTEIIDVTKNFTTYANNGEQITIKEYIESLEPLNDYFDHNYYDDSFQIEMTEYDNIPNVAVFTVKIFLQSGAELISKTQEIKFI